MGMITVGIDTAPLSNQSAFRGVGSYTKNLLESLEQFSEKLKVVSGRRSDIESSVDLMHFPYFDFFFRTLPLSPKKPTVVTVHDCIPLVLSDHYPSGLKGKIRLFFQKTSLKNVSAVIADSETSRKDIVKYLGVPKKKVKVVFLATGKDFKPVESKELLSRVAEKYHLPARFILYVGDVNYNKNLLRLVEAFANLKEKKLGLVLVGKAFENKVLCETKQIRDLVKYFNLEKRVFFPGFVLPEDLPLVYNLAEMYCQPSLYEGFGLQILEAMACGCPVVTGSFSSLPEVAGEAAILVNPQKVESITEGMYKVIKDEKLRCKMIKQGFIQTKKFSWEKTALETIKIYEKILEEQ